MIGRSENIPLQCQIEGLLYVTSIKSLSCSCEYLVNIFKFLHLSYSTIATNGDYPSLYNMGKKKIYMKEENVGECNTVGIDVKHPGQRLTLNICTS